ncbi:MAG: cytochrome c [Planctomycetales bacterium]|nr:cytochrome c [Planctomycetales bacterium]
MKSRNTAKSIVFAVAGLLTAGAPFFSARGEDKRAPAPKFSANSTKGIFFDSVKDAVRGERPTLQSLRKKTPVQVATTDATPGGGEAVTGSGPWDKMITATSIEDEIKRVKLHYDSVVTQPGAFKSGGYEDARRDLMVMSSLFAIISEYGGDVRWKKDAAVARDLFGRTAFNCNAGSTQVFNEASARKDDLQDLISGTGLREGKAQESNDWASIADRTPLMEYADVLKEQLRRATSSADDVKAEPNDVRRPAELIAVLGKILVQEGMDEADDADYVAFSEKMTKASRSVITALERDDYDAIGKAVGAVTQSCDDCHGTYR